MNNSSGVPNPNMRKAYQEGFEKSPSFTLFNVIGVLYDYRVLARTKLTDLKTGQDYLLFVAKMNMKGLLVTSLPTLPIDNPVKLQLNMGIKQQALEITGAVYKIIPTPQGTKGTIIRFIQVTPDQEQNLKKFILQYENEIKNLAQKAPSPAPSIEKTTMVRESSLSHLSLASPDKIAGEIASTMDEEVIHQREKGLSGHTIIANIKNMPSIRDRKKMLRSLLILLITVGSLAAWIYKKEWISFLDERFKLPNSPVKNEVPVQAIQETSPSPAAPNAPATLASITVDIQPAFIKIRLSGDGDFSNHYLSRNSDPKRLILDFPDIESIQEKATVPVGKNPLLRIRPTKQTKGIRVYFDLYPAPFPKYTLLNSPNALDIIFIK